MNFLINLAVVGIAAAVMYRYLRNRRRPPQEDPASIRHLDFTTAAVHVEPAVDDHTSALIVCPHCPETFQHFPAYALHVNVRHGQS
jgi:hypothetical protein